MGGQVESPSFFFRTEERPQLSGKLVEEAAGQPGLEVGGGLSGVAKAGAGGRQKKRRVNSPEVCSPRAGRRADEASGLVGGSGHPESSPRFGVLPLGVEVAGQVGVGFCRVGVVVAEQVAAQVEGLLEEHSGL